MARQLPRKIRVSNDSVSPANTSIVDAETGEVVQNVMVINVILKRHQMTVILTATTEHPPIFTFNQAPDASLGERDYDGLIVCDYFYPVAHCEIEGGV